MKQLADVSPPDIENIDWEKRIAQFMSGRVAVAYCWTMRAARFEHELSSRVARRVCHRQRGVSDRSRPRLLGF